MRKSIVLIGVLFSSFYQSQENKNVKYVSGNVFEITNQDSLSPLPGVNIRFLSSTTGTSTDNKGSFTLPYTPSDNQLIFSYTGYQTDTLEIKNKDNRKVWKDKIRGTFEKLHSIITDSSTIKNFNQRSYGNFLLTNYQYFPKITIVYQRCALICAFGSDLRITFDYNIRYGNKDLFFRDLFLKDKILNRYDVVVMEVKFSNCMPHFLRNLLQYYELSPETFSKYCEAVKKIYKLKD